MAISIRNPRVEELARVMADRSGRGMTEEIIDALEAREQSFQLIAAKRVKKLASIAKPCASAPDLDARPMDEILGYTSDGSFGHGD